MPALARGRRGNPEIIQRMIEIRHLRIVAFALFKSCCPRVVHPPNSGTVGGGFSAPASLSVVKVALLPFPPSASLGRKIHSPLCATIWRMNHFEPLSIPPGSRRLEAREVRRVERCRLAVQRGSVAAVLAPPGLSLRRGRRLHDVADVEGPPPVGIGHEAAVVVQGLEEHGREHVHLERIHLGVRQIAPDARAMRNARAASKTGQANDALAVAG